jgi:GntR family transcriptional repressor for pyruvate dehydrogenase complex
MGKVGDRESTSVRLAADLRRRILNGELAPGMRLPAERVLADDWKVNRHTLREALRLLEAQGLLLSRQGSGATILDFRSQGRLELAPYYFEAIGLSPSIKPEIEAFLALRSSFLVEAAGFAASEATADAKKNIMQAALAIKAAKGDGAKVVELDFAFYQVMVASTNRLLYRWMLNSFAERIQPILTNFAFIWSRPDSYFNSLITATEKIASGDVTSARSTLRAHLEENDKQIIEALVFFLGLSKKEKE